MAIKLITLPRQKLINIKNKYYSRRNAIDFQDYLQTTL